MVMIREEVQQAFARSKEQLKFSSTFEQVDDIFFLNDFFESEGFVSEKFSRAMCRRMCNLFWNWNNYLHNLVVPNPNSMVMVAESQMIDDKVRVEILDVMNKMVAHVARNSVIGLSDDLVAEARFIDDSVVFWREVCQPLLLRVMTYLGAEWKKKASEMPTIDVGPRHP